MDILAFGTWKRQENNINYTNHPRSIYNLTINNYTISCIYTSSEYNKVYTIYMYIIRALCNYKFKYQITMLQYYAG